MKMEFKRCINLKTGKIKFLAPAMYENERMMSRLGYQLLPEVEEPVFTEKPNENEKSNEEVLELQHVAEAQKTKEVTGEKKTWAKMNKEERKIYKQNKEK